MATKKQPKMSFGQYAGVKIIDLPDDYLVWLVTNVNKSWAGARMRLQAIKNIQQAKQELLKRKLNN